MTKHTLSSADRGPAKRVKNSNAASRSTTPADHLSSIPFQVVYPDLAAGKKLSKRDKWLKDNAEVQVSPFVPRGGKEGELDVHHTVVPYEQWDSMKKYSNFIIQQETYKNNEFVYVKGAKDHGDDPKDFWVARILQVRAKDPQHVYALVTWMYWPEELPVTKPRAPDQVTGHSGKRKYHAHNELVASNFLEVLDVLSFAGKVDVSHWDENEELDDNPKMLFWRQTLNKSGEKLSEVRKHCVCDGPWNPDLVMYICDNPTCKTMLHPGCLTSAGAKRKYNELRAKSEGGEDAGDTIVASTTTTNGKKASNTPPPSKTAWAKRFKAEILSSDDPNHPNTRMVIKDLHPDAKKQGDGKVITTWEEKVLCPKCGSAIE